MKLSNKNLFKILLLFLSFALHAEPDSGDLIKLLEISVQNYPAIHAKQLEYLASKKEIDYQKSDFLPKADAFVQGNLGTANNITGMFQPGLVQPISGPPADANNYRPVFGSAAGLLVRWSPLTFGKRESQVLYAVELSNLTKTEKDLYVFDHKIQFIRNYLDYWYVSALTKALEKNFQRYEFHLKMTKALVKSGLRPGVDEAQIQSLFSKTKIELLQARQNKERFRQKTIELLGVDDIDPELDPKMAVIKNINLRKTNKTHPLLEKILIQKKADMAKKLSIDSELLPNLEFWGTGYARGSGIDSAGNTNYSPDGLGFSRYNYGAGFQVTVPLLEYSELKHKMKKQELIIASTAKYKEKIERELRQEYKSSEVTLKNSLEALELSPDYVKSANLAFEALRARYESGLITLTELLQGQYELAKAEADEIHVRVEMFRALLYYSAVLGDLDIFLDQFRDNESKPGGY